MSPLAGYGLAAIVQESRLRQQSNYYRLVGAAITIIGLVWFIDYSLDRNWGLQHSWPNVTGVVEYLKSHGLTEEDRVLADGAPIYEYYFDFGVSDRDTWNNTWYMEFEEHQGTEAMIAAIMEHEFGFVVLDGYYNPSITQALEVVLITAGYIIGYEEVQTLSSAENIHIRVFVAPVYASGETGTLVQPKTKP